MRLNAKDEAILDKLRSVARGRTTREIAAAINVRFPTLQRWLRRHKPIRQRLRQLQENSLFN